MKNNEQLKQQDLSIWLSLKLKFQGITAAITCRPSAICIRDHNDYQDDDARLKGESSAKRQKTSEYETYLVGESSSGQAMEQDPNPSGLGSDEMSKEIDEAKLKKVVKEIIRQMLPIKILA
nr:hypothetical protein [Tanacetum cinerariifolium]